MNEKVKEILKCPYKAGYMNVSLLKPDILFFTELFFDAVKGQRFAFNWHHAVIADKLNDILSYRHPTNHLIINIPPRHTKTELAVISFVSLGFGMNPASEFMHFSASDALVIRNATFIRSIMESDVYGAVFPNCRLDNNAKASILTTSGGVLYAAPFLGQITGFGCGRLDSKTFAGAMIIDDPVKTQDALSETVREKVNFTWANTLISRRNDHRTPVIVIGQRVHENDFCGFLLKEEGAMKEGGKWDVITIPAIIDEGLPSEKALWEKRISLHDLKKQRELDGWAFETQYMQNPMPLEGLMYERGFKTYRFGEVPASRKKIIKNYTDTADTGADFLCSIDYLETEFGMYIMDVLYTDKPMEYTEPETARMIHRDKVQRANIESNNGGRGFARNVERELRSMGNSGTVINWFTQNMNKSVRIFSRSNEVQNLIYMPDDWRHRWPAFAKGILSYRKTGGNKHDDHVDCLTGMVEFFGKDVRKHQDLSMYF